MSNTIKVPRKVLDEIEQRAKQSYPLEVLGYLIGTKQRVEQVIWPRQTRDEESVSALKGEYERLNEEHGGRIVGTIHTHPKCDICIPSGSDHSDVADRYYMALVAVFEENKVKKTNMMWWRPLQELNVVPTGRKRK
jgi:proteasome lid subunit RPN8/RPN11